MSHCVALFLVCLIIHYLSGEDSHSGAVSRAACEGAQWHHYSQQGKEKAIRGHVEGARREERRGRGASVRICH